MSVQLFDQIFVLQFRSAEATKQKWNVLPWPVKLQSERSLSSKMYFVIVMFFNLGIGKLSSYFFFRFVFVIRQTLENAVRHWAGVSASVWVGIGPSLQSEIER